MPTPKELCGEINLLGKAKNIRCYFFIATKNYVFYRGNLAVAKTKDDKKVFTIFRRIFQAD